MKKSLLALAVLGAFAGVASAQSSVTLYGTIDLNGRYVKNEGTSARWSMGQDGINSSQLGFKGVEDLGGGLKASFVLLAGVNADTGTSNTTTSLGQGTSSQFWNRRATVSLSNQWGELRLGRDYTPTFWNYTIFDAFGTNGIGDSSHVLFPALTQSTFVRANNSIGYFLPAMGGFYGQFMVAAGEGIATGKYEGGRLGYAAGPFDVAGSYAQTGSPVGLPDAKSWSIGGSWDFKVAKIMGYYAETKVNATNQVYSISGIVPMGAGEIHASWSEGKVSDFNTKASQFALGYVYNLSKRTALYATGSYLNNSNNGQNSIVAVGNSTSGAALPVKGGYSEGVEFGVRHFF